MTTERGVNLLKPTSNHTFVPPINIPNLPPFSDCFWWAGTCAFQEVQIGPSSQFMLSSTYVCVFQLAIGEQQASRQADRVLEYGVVTDHH